jgi:glycosyltransferase involved in cell wall biosynthesis
MAVHSQIRILHVVGGMNRGGVETWLMNVVRHVDRERFKMDFLVHTEAVCAFDSEIRALGSSVIPCLNPSEPRSYARAFRKILSEHAPYDVVHSHVHHFSGFVLRLANQMNVPVRIAHSHNDTATVNAKAGLRRQFYLGLMRRWIAHYATDGLAASRQAAAALLGRSWDADPRYRVLPYSIDLDPFRRPVDRQGTRAALDLPEDAFVVGHVGRFDPQKNHDFLVDIAAELVRLEPRARLVLVGAGPLHSTIRARVRDGGLEDRVLFLGVRADAIELMRAAFDVFLLPSFHEGLPVVSIEAQAAGLPCVLTSSIAQEADIVPGLVKRVSLDESPAAWSREALAAQDRSTTPAEALAFLENSAFNIQRGLAALADVYTSSASRDLPSSTTLLPQKAYAAQ